MNPAGETPAEIVCISIGIQSYPFLYILHKSFLFSLYIYSRIL